MPHVSIRHLPKDLDEKSRAALVAAVTHAVTSAFEVDEGVVSIALEPVDDAEWQRRVYGPEIVDRRELLVKTPSY